MQHDIIGGRLHLSRRASYPSRQGAADGRLRHVRRYTEDAGVCLKTWRSSPGTGHCFSASSPASHAWPGNLASLSPPKCASLTHVAGKVTAVVPLTITDREIRELQEDEAEPYIGTPSGSRVCFRNTWRPWRTHFSLPGKSWRFSGASCCRPCLTTLLPVGFYELDPKCLDFLAGAVTKVPPAPTKAFLR